MGSPGHITKAHGKNAVDAWVVRGHAEGVDSLDTEENPALAGGHLPENRFSALTLRRSYRSEAEPAIFDMTLLP